MYFREFVLMYFRGCWLVLVTLRFVIGIPLDSDVEAEKLIVLGDAAVSDNFIFQSAAKKLHCNFNNSLHIQSSMNCFSGGYSKSLDSRSNLTNNQFPVNIHRKISNRIMRNNSPLDFTTVPKVSLDCKNHTNYFLNSLKNLDLWALKSI